MYSTVIIKVVVPLCMSGSRWLLVTGALLVMETALTGSNVQYKDIPSGKGTP